MSHLRYSLVWREPSTDEIRWIAIGKATTTMLAIEIDDITEPDITNPDIYYGATEWTYAWMPDNGGIDPNVYFVDEEA